MSGAPARPWYEHVIGEIAIRGWTKSQLSERSGVSRTAIDKWRTNPRPPQAASVNAVADALGVPRERALRMAGVIVRVSAESESLISASLRREIMAQAGLTDEQRQAVIAAVEETLARERGAEAWSPAVPADADPEQPRQAS